MLRILFNAPHSTFSWVNMSGPPPQHLICHHVYIYTVALHLLYMSVINIIIHPSYILICMAVYYSKIPYKTHCIFRKFLYDHTTFEVLNKCFRIITFNTFFSASAPFFFLTEVGYDKIFNLVSSRNEGTNVGNNKF
jgi:hypothetical protein